MALSTPSVAQRHADGGERLGFNFLRLIKTILCLNFVNVTPGFTA